MKPFDIRLAKELHQSFLFYKETNPFSVWHHHPEYELVLITKGKGRKMVGDYIDRFEKYDLTFLGVDMPHEWLCDPEYFGRKGEFYGEGIVIQFVHDFLGETFMEIHENASLKNFLKDSARGIEFYGTARDDIIDLMLKMEHMPESERLYVLFSIFRIFMESTETRLLASPAFFQSIRPDSDDLMQKARNYIHQHFQHNLQIKDLLEETCMSNTAFFGAFKLAFSMTFKEYLLKIRVGYACKLLMEGSKPISEIAYLSGFENISNFNRQFKKIKHLTPSQYLDEINKTQR